MQLPSKYNTKENLEYIIANFKSDKLTAQDFQEMQEEIRKNMASFHIEERIRIAKAEEELRNFIITA